MSRLGLKQQLEKKAFEVRKVRASRGIDDITCLVTTVLTPDCSALSANMKI